MFKKLSLEEKLAVALSRFAKKKGNKPSYSISCNSSPVMGSDYREVVLKLTVYGERKHFSAAVMIDSKGKAVEPVYLSRWSTAEGDLYEEFYNYIKNNYGIKSETRAKN